jgi:predicted Zn finger-like uncharacterized protein
MIVQCPKCKTKYKIGDELVHPEGTPVRCSRCKEVFEVTPGEPASAPSVAGNGRQASSPSSEEQARDEDFLGLGGGLSGSTRPSPSSPVAEENEEILHPDSATAQRDASISERLGLAEDNAAVPDEANKNGLPAEDSPVPRRKGRTAVLLLLLLILLLAAGVYFFYPQIKPYLPAWLDQRVATTSGDKGLLQKNVQGSEVEHITLLDVRQYFVSNDKIGQLFVIEGRAVNGYSSPKELIKLQATLYDGEDRVLESKQFLCGNTVSLFQLQVLTKEELESTLNSKVGVLTNNTNLQPGAEVPFMTVFPNPPQDVQEFGVNVIDIKDRSK